MNSKLQKSLLQLTKNDNDLSFFVENIRQKFIQNYPKENISQLTIDDYGKRSDSFCKLIECGLILNGLSELNMNTYNTFLRKSHDDLPLDSIYFQKYGVYWSTINRDWLWYKSFKKQTAIEAFEEIKNGLKKLVDSVEGGHFERLDNIMSMYLNQNPNTDSFNLNPLYFLGLATLYFYYPQHFIPIFNEQILDEKLNGLGLSIQGGLITKNLNLLNHLKLFPEFSDFNTWEMKYFGSIPLFHEYKCLEI